MSAIATRPVRVPVARLTVHVDQVLAERLGNAAHAHGQSIAAWLQQAIADAVTADERRFNEGQPFAPRPRIGA